MPRLGAIMKTTTILATVILLATTMLAQAGVIFSDDFNRVPSNIVGNGWAETEFGATDAQLIDTASSWGITQQLRNSINARTTQHAGRVRLRRYHHWGSNRRAAQPQ